MKTLIRKPLSALLLLAGLIVTRAAEPPQRSSPPPPAPTTLSLLVADAHKHTDAAAAQRAFAEYLRRCIQPSLTEPNAPAVLRAVTARQAAEPARVVELLAEYGRWHGDGRPEPRVKRPRDLDPRHLTEAYRAAWETLLLAPPGEEIRFMGTRFLITRALASIGSPESLPVLELAFRSASAAGVEQRPGSLALDRQLRIIEALQQFRSEAGLKTLMICLAETEKPNGSATTEISGKTLRQWAVLHLSDERDPGHRAQWKNVSSRFPRQGLTPSEIRLLDEVNGRQPR